MQSLNLDILHSNNIWEVTYGRLLSSILSQYHVDGITSVRDGGPSVGRAEVEEGIQKFGANLNEH